jgi:hypothetical protein
VELDWSVFVADFEQILGKLKLYKERCFIHIAAEIMV